MKNNAIKISSKKEIKKSDKLEKNIQKYFDWVDKTYIPKGKKIAF